MEQVVKEGQFWLNTARKNVLVEIYKVVEQTNTRVDTLVRFWHKTSIGHYHMINKNPINSVSNTVKFMGC